MRILDPSVNYPASYMVINLSIHIHIIWIRRAKDMHATRLRWTKYRIIQASSDHSEGPLASSMFRPFERFHGAGQRSSPPSVILMPATLG
jgi:hypothetical protein